MIVLPCIMCLCDRRTTIAIIVTAYAADRKRNRGAGPRLGRPDDGRRRRNGGISAWTTRNGPPARL